MTETKETTNESNSSLATFTITAIDEDGLNLPAPMTTEERRNARLHLEGDFTIDFSKMFGNK